MSRSKEEIQNSINSNKNVLDHFEQSLKELEQKKKDAESRIIELKSGSSTFRFEGNLNGNIVGQNVTNARIIDNNVRDIDRDIKQLKDLIEDYQQKIKEDQKLLDQI